MQIKNNVTSFQKECVAIYRDNVLVFRQWYSWKHVIIFGLCLFLVVSFWLSSFFDNFFGIEKLRIPVTPFVLGASLVMLIYLVRYGKKYSAVKIGKSSADRLAFYGIAIFFMSTIVWSFSSSRYYYGVDSALRKTANVYWQGTSIILNDKNIGDDEKKRLLEKFLSTNQRGEFSLLKNGGLYLAKPPDRNSEHHGPIPYDENFKTIKTETDIYDLSYVYYNEPNWEYGFLTALTLSCIPDLLEFTGKNYNEFYVSRRFYNRSFSFWIPFWMLVIALGILFLRGVHKEFQLNNNRANLLRLAFHHLQEETQHSLANSRNILQELSSRYEKEFDDEIKVLGNRLEMAARKEKHDLGNKWRDSEVYRQNKEIQSYIESIVENLDSIPSAISIQMKDYPLEEIKKRAPKYIASYTDRSSGFVHEITIPERAGTMKANLHHFWSIISNLVGNAKEATQQRKKALRKPGEPTRFKRFTSLKIYVSEGELVIVVEDNGGGFPDVQKIYREAVLSTKPSYGKKREGEGTTYIRMFTEMMGGTIEAENIIREGEPGARTKISFPIQKSEEA